MTTMLATASAAGRSDAPPPAAARASTSTPAAAPPIASPTIGAQAIAAPTSARSGESGVRKGSRVNTDTESRSARSMSVAAVADAGLVERRHLGQRRDRHLHDRQRDERGGTLTEPQVEVNHRRKPERVEDGALGGLARTMSGNPPVARARCDA